MSRRVDTLGFVGVTATHSSINQVFPRWARVLGLDDVAFEPIELPLDARPEAYRAILAEMRADEHFRGALVTTHKVRLLEAARDMFDELDRYAALLGEVSSISKRDGCLIGHAKDPITAGRALEEFLPERHFARTEGAVLCIGAGGAGLAIAVYLLTEHASADRPSRLILVARSEHRLEACRSALATLGVADGVAYVCNAAEQGNDEIMAGLPPGSLVINATGMGKDRPGSPLTDGGRFPADGLVWELNYRGDLRFLEQARRQKAGRSLRIEDGWRYFVHGWSAVIAEVFGLEIDAPTLERLSVEAEAERVV